MFGIFFLFLGKFVIKCDLCRFASHKSSMLQCKKDIYILQQRCQMSHWACAEHVFYSVKDILFFHFLLQNILINWIIYFSVNNNKMSVLSGKGCPKDNTRSTILGIGFWCCCAMPVVLHTYCCVLLPGFIWQQLFLPSVFWIISVKAILYCPVKLVSYT